MFRFAQHDKHLFFSGFARRQRHGKCMSSGSRKFCDNSIFGKLRSDKLSDKNSEIILKINAVVKLNFIDKNSNYNISLLLKFVFGLWIWKTR